MENINEILTYLNTGGIVAVLVVGLHAFATGAVLPKDATKRIIRETVYELLEELERRNMWGDYS